jgi:hypothetical protein
MALPVGLQPGVALGEDVGVPEGEALADGDGEGFPVGVGLGELEPTTTSSMSVEPATSFQSWRRWYGVVVAKLPLTDHAGCEVPLMKS